MQGPAAPQPSNLAVLQGAQQLGLGVRRQLGDLVQEEYAVVRHLEVAGARNRVRVGALFRSEEFTLHDHLRQGPAVDRQEGEGGPGGETVYGSRRELLAGAAFPGQEYGEIIPRHQLDLGTDVLDGLAVP